MNKDEEIIKLAQFLHNRYCNEDACCKDINECKICNCTSKALAEVLYKEGYRKVPDGAVILTPKERDEELKACNEKQAELEAKIEILKIQNNNLEIAFDRLEARSELFESNMKSVLEIEKKNAVKEFAERVKAKAFDKDMFNDWAGATYVVLVRDIDELLKEFVEKE